MKKKMKLVFWMRHVPSERKVLNDEKHTQKSKFSFLIEKNPLSLVNHSRMSKSKKDRKSLASLSTMLFGLWEHCVSPSGKKNKK